MLIQRTIFVRRTFEKQNRMGHIKATLLTLCLLAILPLYAVKWSPQTLPMPYLQDERKHVCNPDQVISAAAEDSINARLYALEHEKGVQAIFVAVEHIEGDDPYTFAMDLGRKYGIGSKASTGLIVVLASKDRSYQILTGNGLEGTLPDAICRRIENRTMVPLLREEKWSEALVATASDIDRYIRKDPTLQYDDESEDDLADLGIAVLVVAFVFGITLFSFISVQRRKRCPQCKHKPMKVISRKRVRNITTGSYHIRVVYQCPKCGCRKTDYENDVQSNSSSGGLFPPPFLGGTGHSGGSSFGGGSFGGGSFGGGGSGGRF